MEATIDLNEVAIFIRVVEQRSFTAAAKVLGLPKSSVSRRVAEVEEALGVRLLQRTTRKLSLTDAGAAYYQRAARALSDLEDASGAAREMQSAPRGLVRMTAPVEFGTGHLPGMLARFLRRYPGIRVEIELSGRRVDLVAEGFDLALRAGRLADSTLVAKKITTTESRLFASPRYLGRRGTPARVRDLADHDCVLFRPSGGANTWQIEGPGGVETVEVTGRVGGDTLMFVRRMMLAGCGIGLVPWHMCAQDLARGKLVRVLPDHVFHAGTLSLVYPSSRHLPRRVVLLRDFLLKSFSPPPWEKA